MGSDVSVHRKSLDPGIRKNNRYFAFTRHHRWVAIGQIAMSHERATSRDGSTV